MKRIFNYIFRIRLSALFSLRFLPVLLGATLFLIWYSVYISNTNVSSVKVKYNSVNLCVDSLNFDFYINSNRLRVAYNECDKIEIQEYFSIINSAKCLPVQFDSLHRHHYCKIHDYYEDKVHHQKYHYVFPEEYDLCPSEHRYSNLSIFEIQGHEISGIDNDTLHDSIKSNIQHYGLNFTKWIDRHIGNYSNLKDMDLAYSAFSYGYRGENLSIGTNEMRTISAQGYMFHDFHPNFNYNIEFNIEGLGYDDSVMYDIPITLRFYFNRRKHYLLAASPVPDRMTGHVIEYHSKDKIAEILQDGISINGTDVFVKEHYDKKATLITLVIGVLLSLLSSMVVSDIEKKKNTNNYSPKYWIYFVCDILKGIVIALCCILANIVFVNPYTWD